VDVRFFFFFKQKTAYEIFTWLEFRRVLFRSLVEAAVLLDRPAWLEPARRAAHLLRTLHVRDGRVARVSLSGRLSPAPGTADDHRSEERRVGKECRSRSTPQQTQAKRTRA